MRQTENYYILPNFSFSKCCFVPLDRIALYYLWRLWRGSKLNYRMILLINWLRTASRPPGEWACTQARRIFNPKSVLNLLVKKNRNVAIFVSFRFFHCFQWTKARNFLEKCRLFSPNSKCWRQISITVCWEIHRSWKCRRSRSFAIFNPNGFAICIYGMEKAKCHHENVTNFGKFTKFLEQIRPHQRPTFVWDDVIFEKAIEKA